MDTDGHGLVLSLVTSAATKQAELRRNPARTAQRAIHTD